MVLVVKCILGSILVFILTRCACGEKTLVCVEVSVGLLFVLPLTAASPTFKSQPLTSIGLQQSENAPEVNLQRVSGSPTHMVVQVMISVQGLFIE